MLNVMKSRLNGKTFLQTLFFFLLVTQLTFAQKDGTASAGPIPKLRLERNHTQVNPGQNPLWGTAYGYSNIQNYTLSMPIPDGTPFTLLSSWTPPYFASSMIQRRDGPRYYYITEVGPPAALYQMDSETGAVSLVGNITGMDVDQPNGISYYYANSTYYIVSSTNFYSFDVSTRTATLIGSFNVSGSIMIDLCFDWLGVCYAYDLVTDAAYTINISTGNATLLGPLGYDANYGQGMSYDYDTGTIYLSAFNNATVTGQLRTMEPSTGMTTLITDWGFEQIAPFSLPAFPCTYPIPPPSNPSPANGATNVPITGVTLNWINGTYTINVEVWFGLQGNVVKVYDGVAITSWPLETLLYSTHYRWHIVCKDTTCGESQGPSWIFTTENALGVVFIEPFNDLSCWTWIGPLGQVNWNNPGTTNAGGTAPELRCSWTPTYVGLNQLLSCVINTTDGHSHEIRFKYKYDWYEDPAPLHGLAITYDGGATSTTLWEQTPVGGNTGPEEVILQYTPSSSSFQLIIYNNGDSDNIDYIYYDDIQITDLDIVPVELSSFTAIDNEGVVELSWITATEKNNKGFEVQRSSGSDFETIGFVDGSGTTTEVQTYLYIDRNVNTGLYSYRLKQVDFDGKYEYSNIVEVDVPALTVFALDQNYPNPCNPSTTISWQLAEGRDATLKVYDILGREVATLVNEYRPAGKYETEFNAVNLPSGVYFYQVKAGDFIQTKKMILMK